MPVMTRAPWIAAAAAIALLSPSLPRLAAQDARAILLEPGQVNASVEGASWWLANQSIVVTWSTAGGSIRLASVYDRLGGRTEPKAGETFPVALPGGGGRTLRPRLLQRRLTEPPGDRDPGARTMPEAGIRAVRLAQPHDATLVPFFKAADHRYTVYWRLFTPAQWAERKADVAAAEGKRQIIERNTIDVVDVRTVKLPGH